MSTDASREPREGHLVRMTSIPRVYRFERTTPRTRCRAMRRLYCDFSMGRGEKANSEFCSVTRSRHSSFDIGSLELSQTRGHLAIANKTYGGFSGTVNVRAYWNRIRVGRFTKPNASQEGALGVKERWRDREV